MIGKTIGRYQIIKQLGEGGMAIVYQAYDTHLDSHVALKIIRKERLMLDGSGELLERFEAEAKRVARLSNPHIIPILDYGEFENTPFLVMKFIPGGTLKDRSPRRYHWQEAARLLIPIARALSYAHQQGIVHRDVKPGNILLTETGEPMLSDFGIAMTLLEKDAEPTHDREDILGTPEYMAPEQALGKKVDHRVDIYALGLIYYELITGRMPFTAETPISVLMKHIYEPLPPARQYAPDLPEMAQRVVARALEKSPDDRFASMEDFFSALQRLAQQENKRGYQTVPLEDDNADEQPTDPGKASEGWHLIDFAHASSGHRRAVLWVAAVVVTLLAVMVSGLGLAIFNAGGDTNQLGVFAAPATVDPLPTYDADPTELAFNLQAARQTEESEAAAAIRESATAASQASKTASMETVIAGTAEAIESADKTKAAASTKTAQSALEKTNGPAGFEAMRTMVRSLHQEGILTTTEGTYHQLADFEESWAQLGWYQWWFTGYELKDFVVRAHTRWESASSTADWFNAGCGFVFRETDPANHYMIYLGLDGYVYLRGYINGTFRELGKEYYGRIQNVEGEADIALVVSGDQIRYYVDGQRVMRRTNNELNAGNLSYTLVSGTNLTFGTRCSITDVELWQPDGP